METALLRLDGVANAAAKTSKQMFVVLYKPGASFQPKAIRDAVSELGVEVVRFHIMARGTVNEEDGKQFFTAGKDRFLVVSSDKQPTNCTLGIAGTVDDSTSPPQVKIDDSKQLK
jgi:hypothetical protein